MKKVSMLLLLSLIVVLLAACGGEQAQPTATAEPAAPPAVEEAALTMMFDPVLTTVVDLCGEQALTVNAVEDTLAPEISAQLDRVLVRLVQAAPRSGPGASMLIITPQRRYDKSTGVADVTTGEPLAADSSFQIGSNTKMMTSAILSQLQAVRLVLL